jgi:homoserine dehydrogenase
MKGGNKKMMKAGIIGFGNVGKKLREKLSENGWGISFVATSEHVFVGDYDTPKDKSENWLNYCHDTNLVFLTIPTLDDGKLAFDYIAAITSKGISVVTCEKGALSNYFSDIKPTLPHIGYSATVGGGSGIIHFLKRRFFSGTLEVHAIVNGTLNYIWNDLKIGNPLGHIVEEVKKLGYAEPGEKNPIKIILGEAGPDVTKKTSILFNLCFCPKTILRAKDINVVITEEMVKRAISEAMNRRFVVSFEKEQNFKSDSNDVLAFIHHIDGWVITGGFKKTDSNPLIARLCNSAAWVNNAVLTLEGEDGSGGICLCVGPGAGSSPVASAMIRDAEQLLL